MVVDMFIVILVVATGVIFELVVEIAVAIICLVLGLVMVRVDVVSEISLVILTLVMMVLVVMVMALVLAAVKVVVIFVMPVVIFLGCPFPDPLADLLHENGLLSLPLRLCLEELQIGMLELQRAKSLMAGHGGPNDVGTALVPFDAASTAAVTNCKYILIAKRQFANAPCRFAGSC